MSTRTKKILSNTISITITHIHATVPDWIVPLVTVLEKAYYWISSTYQLNIHFRHITIEQEHVD